MSARRIFSHFLFDGCREAQGWGGRDRNLYANSVLQAIDYKTGKIKWSHELGEGEGIAGILTTAGKLLFTADNAGNLLAMDPATGKTLWHSYGGGRVLASPMTYELDGRQYVVFQVQDVLFAFALPQTT